MIHKRTVLLIFAALLTLLATAASAQTTGAGNTETQPHDPLAIDITIVRGDEPAITIHMEATGISSVDLLGLLKQAYVLTGLNQATNGVVPAADCLTNPQSIRQP